VYAANDILDDTGITVTKDYLNFFVGTTSKTAGYPFTPTTTFTPNGFGGFIETDPAGSWYEVTTPTSGGVDFNLAANSLAMFSRNSYGSTASAIFALSKGTTTGQENEWNPCSENTLTLSFNQARVISVPGGGWGAAPSNAINSYLKIFESASGSPRVVDVEPFINYDRATGDYDNGITVTDQSGTVTTYSFGTTATSAADVEIKLIITPVEPTITSPVKNRWNIEFDVTGAGSSLTIPSFEFEMAYLSRFKISQIFSYSCSTAANDKYKISDATIALSNTVIP